MIATVRTAGFAAALFACAASMIFSTPTKAWDAPAAAVSADREAIAGVAEQMLEMADAAVPRPRTLDEQVGAYGRIGVADAEQDCLANAVYFEARGEPIQGQLAVAEVVLNRVASKKYPDTICEVVVQPWQFSFVDHGRIPAADRSSASWRKAVAIARLAQENRAAALSSDVLWYHADYVAPSWGKRLDRETKIGLHIFYT